eukprot:g28649.t1
MRQICGTVLIWPLLGSDRGIEAVGGRDPGGLSGPGWRRHPDQTFMAAGDTREFYFYAKNLTSPFSLLF